MSLSTTHFQIFDYWKDKMVNEDLQVVNYIENPIAKGIDIITDWGEPECWACGKFVDKISVWNDYEKLLKQDDGLKYIWNHKIVASKLNRCHIISKQFGGSDDSDNLFLMCETCHIASPDTTNYKIFLAWVLNRRNECIIGKTTPLIFQELDKLCKMLNLNTENVLMTVLETKSLKRVFAKAGMHGFKISPSSLASVLIDAYWEIEESKTTKLSAIKKMFDLIKL